jgi:hypothetical protein
MLHAGLDLSRRRIDVCLSVGGRRGGRGVRAQLGVGMSFPVTLPLAEIVEGLNRFQPTESSGPSAGRS